MHPFLCGHMSINTLYEKTTIVHMITRVHSLWWNFNGHVHMHRQELIVHWTWVSGCCDMKDNCLARFSIGNCSPFSARKF